MKKLFTTMLLAAASLTGFAQVWIDVTDQYIINPRFDNNDVKTGWQGTAFTANNPYGNAEHYNNSNYKTYQNLTGLKPGKYRVSVSAFYRMGSSDNDYRLYKQGNYASNQKAKLYVQTNNGTRTTSVPIIPASAEKYNDTKPNVGDWSELSDNDGGWWYWGPYYYIPSNMQAANYAFEDGKYTNTIECTVGNDKTLTIGIEKTSKINNDWTCLDNWKLEYLGDASEIAGAIVINEIMAANVDVYLDPSFNYGSWVELYNNADFGFSLGGLYVTDDETNLKKHRLIDSYGYLPAKGFAILNFGHYEVYTKPSYRQIDDKLDCDGGKIIISDGTNILAEAEYETAISRMSYALTTDGGTEWGLSGNPTPGASNENGKFAEYQLDAPIVDKDAQLYSGTLNISVKIPAGATLKYTTDGTTPTLTNGQTTYTGVFRITNKTTCYRFRLFKNGYLPSPVVTRTYIYKEKEYPLPIISVVTNDKNLNSQEYGVFVKGNGNGRPGSGQDNNSNWNMDWDRPVSVEYITAPNAKGERECIVSQECDLTMCGGWSRAWEPHSFKLKAGKEYDFMNYFAAPLFDKKPYIKNKTLQIRNGGNNVQTYSSRGGRIRDAIIQQIVARSGINIDYQEWQPVHVLINGKYHGTLSMREPNNKHHGYANYGIDTDEMDQFEVTADSGYVQMEGTDEAWLHLVELSKNAADEEAYAEIRQLLEMDEYINLMAAEFYLGGTDWPHNNVKGYRDRNGGKFHFVLFDQDFAGEVYNSDRDALYNDPFKNFFNKEEFQSEHALAGYDYAQNKSLNGTYKKYTNTFVTLFKNLLQNDGFRKQFIDTYCIMGGSIMQEKYVKAIANEMKNYIQKGINAHSEDRFDPSISSNYVINKFNKSWDDKLTTTLKNRSEIKLSSVAKQSVNISSNNADAKITYNDINLPYAEFDGYLFAPVTLKATAPAGYRFKGWRDASKTGDVYLTEEAEYTLPSSGTQKVVAMFEKISQEDMLAEGITPVRINEVSAANSIYINDYYKKNDWMELYNTTDEDIDIKGMTIIHTSDKSKQAKWHEYLVPSDDVTLNTIIPAHGYKVLWCDQLDIIGADIHTGFKLETKGGDVIIVTENYKDTLSYEQHLGTQTYGRYPDGANDVYVMNIPTIAKTNQLGSYDTYFEKPVKPTPEPDAIQSYTKEGGITIAYVDGSVNIKSEDSPIKSADIYNMSGMKMAATSFAHGGNKFVSINVASLPKGIYLVSTTTEDGDECHIKFVIK